MDSETDEKEEKEEGGGRKEESQLLFSTGCCVGNANAARINGERIPEVSGSRCK